MTLNLDDLMYQKSNGARIDNALIRQESLIRIRRGVYLPASLLPATYQAWQVRQAISVARALSTTAVSKSEEPPIMTLECALLLRGLQIWNNTPNITFRRQGVPSHPSPRELPLVNVRGMKIGAVTERQLRTKSAPAEVEQVGKIWTPTLPSLALDVARNLVPFHAVVAVSSILRELSQYNRFERAKSTQVCRILKQELADDFRHQGNPWHQEQGLSVLRAADGAIESPGEGFLLWILHGLLESSALRDEIVCQWPITIQGRRYYADVALPNLKALFEFDGYSKVDGKRHQFVERQRLLVEAGWHILRVELREVSTPRTATLRVKAFLESLGVHTPNHWGRWWAETSRTSRQL